WRSSGSSMARVTSTRFSETKSSSMTLTSRICAPMLLTGVLGMAVAGVSAPNAAVGDSLQSSTAKPVRSPPPVKPTPKPHNAPVKLAPEAEKVHRDALLIDGHNDLPWQFRRKRDLSFLKIDLHKDQKALGLHTDIPRLKRGNVGAQFWSAYVSARTSRTGTAV